VTVHIRDLMSGDEAALRRVLRNVAIFEPYEIEVAEDLIAEALTGSGEYLIHVASGEGTPDARVVGYVCHGHNPVTDAVYDLYWIAVDPSVHGRGIGRQLMAYTEDRVRGLHGRGIVIETSDRPAYEPAKRLYEKCGYEKVAEIPDFYKPGDGQLVYAKFFSGTHRRTT